MADLRRGPGCARQERWSLKAVSNSGQSTAAQETSPKIRIESLSFRYGNVTGQMVLADFTLDVFPHEVITIVGPSGCGKSTLLHLVAGLLIPTSGRILLDGAPVGGPGPDRVMVFQEDAVFPWYTVRQNVQYASRLKLSRVRVRERDQLVRHYLEMVGLVGCEDMYPRQLSGGMRKRVDVARAMAAEPEVLLMDEPLAALDVITKARLQEELVRLWQRSRMTVMFVTHDLEEALFLGSRVVVMSRSPGRIARVVEVPKEWVRNPDLRMSQAFQDLRRELAHLLDNAQGPSRGTPDAPGR